MAATAGWHIGLWCPQSRARSCLFLSLRSQERHWRRAGEVERARRCGDSKRGLQRTQSRTPGSEGNPEPETRDAPRAPRLWRAEQCLLVNRSRKPAQEQDALGPELTWGAQRGQAQARPRGAEDGRPLSPGPGRGGSGQMPGQTLRESHVVQVDPRLPQASPRLPQASPRLPQASPRPPQGL